VFFDATSSGTCTIASGNTGARSINCTGFTGVIAGTTAITVAGSVTLDAGMTYSHTGTVTFTGTGTLTTAGKNFSAVTVNGAGITVTLGDALNISTRTLTLTRGTFNANNYSVTAGRFASSNSNTRTLTMGSGLWTLINAGASQLTGPWNTDVTTNLTFNKNTANILLSNTSTGARVFYGGGLTFNKLTIGGATGTSTTSFFGVNSFSELASTKTVAHTVRFVNNQGTIDTWSITGTSGNVVTVDSSVAGTQRNFNLTNVTSGIDYLSVKDIAVNQANRFYVGVNSTDGGNNLNVIFTAPPSGYTITAVNGTYSLSGQTATLSFGRLLSAANGTYSLSGQTATLSFGRLLTAVNGTYLVSGQTATLSFGRLLSAQNGVYSVAGQAVDISVGAPPAPTLGIELFVEIRSFTERRRF
jgi:hypothetical protein